jgi:Zn-dependent oligopeptidase
MKTNFFNNHNIKNQMSWKLNCLPVNDFLKYLEIHGQIIKKSLKTLSTIENDLDFLKALESLFVDFDKALNIAFVSQSLYQNKKMDKALVKATNLKIDICGLLTNDYLIYLRLTKVNKKVLNDAQKNLVDHWLKQFMLSGVNLSLKQQKRIKTIEKRIAFLEKNHEKIITKETYSKTFKVLINKVQGIPNTILSDAKKQGQYYIFNDTHSGEILSFAQEESVRRQAYLVSKSIGKSSLVKKILIEINQLRQEMAKILGYKSYNQLVLSGNMVKQSKTLDKTIDGLIKKLKPLALKKHEEIIEFIKTNKSKEDNYNFPFYQNLYLEKNFNINHQELKEYFPEKQVIKGLLIFLEKFMNLKFKKIKKSFLTSYEVFYKNNLVGYFSLDLYQRPHKNTGAWMDTLKSGGFNEKPWVLLACNFNPQDKYLDLESITTLFHEMGHVIHGLINNSLYPSQNGTNVSEDFVEFPSQFMENLVFNEKVLKLITTKPKHLPEISKKFIKKIKKYQYHYISSWILRQIFYLQLDQRFHRENINSNRKLFLLESKIFKNLYHEKLNPKFSEIESFGHLVDSNYGSNYYVYLWSSIIEKDIYQSFQNSLSWNKIEPLFRTQGVSEMKVLAKVKKKIVINNFLKAYQIS